MRSASQEYGKMMEGRRGWIARALFWAVSVLYLGLMAFLFSNGWWGCSLIKDSAERTATPPAPSAPRDASMPPMAKVQGGTPAPEPPLAGS